MRERHDLSDPTPWRRSLRASQARRAAAATRRRRGSRSRGALTAAVLGLSVAATERWPRRRPSPQRRPHPRCRRRRPRPRRPSSASPPTASPARRPGAPSSASSGTRACPWTASSAGRRSPPSASSPPPRRARRAPARQRRPRPPRSADASALLESIALCESGGDPTAVSPSGQYRGKYQFSRATWKALGGTGDPAAAPESEQDAKAEQLMSEQGPSAWPVCSKQVGAG